jgi:DNA-binding MarR family transcriptional regulator
LKRSKVREKISRFELFQFTPLSKQILEFVGAGRTATDVVKLLGCSKSTVSYHVNRFVEQDLLRLKFRDVRKFYELTPLGSKVLTRSDDLDKSLVILEDYPFKFSIIEEEKSRIDWHKLGKPRNWVKLGVKIGRIRVEKNGDKSIVIRSGQLRGFDIHSLLVEAGSIIQSAKFVLEHKFGMVLSDVGVPLHEPIARFYTPEAEELNKFGTVVVEGVASLDHSPPKNLSHLEYQGVSNIKNYLLMPIRVARIEQKLDSLEENLERLTTTLEQVVEPLSKMVNLMESNISENQESKSGKVDSYIR